MSDGQDDDRATDRFRAAGGRAAEAAGGGHDEAAGGVRRGGLVHQGADRAPARPPAAAADAREPATEPARGGRVERSAVGWVGVLVAALLTAWQIVFAASHQGLEPADQDVYAAVSLFVTLVLSVGAMVLGLVALSQQRGPRWPAVVALAVGVQVFLVTVATWAGDLATGGA